MDGLVNGKFKSQDIVVLVTERIYGSKLVVKIGANILVEFDAVLGSSDNNGYGWMVSYLNKYCYTIDEVVTDIYRDYMNNTYTLLDDIMKETAIH